MSGRAWRSRKEKHSHNIYVVGNVGGKPLSLHRFLMNPPPGMQVDHINGNGLDNRRSNLRLCSGVENLRNKRVTPRTKRGDFKGVSEISGGHFCARIQINGVKKWLGTFIAPLDAAIAYDIAAEKHFGAFAALNIPGRDASYVPTPLQYRTRAETIAYRKAFNLCIKCGMPAAPGRVKCESHLERARVLWKKRYRRGRAGAST